jgi:hypothetical protein
VVAELGLKLLAVGGLGVFLKLTSVRTLFRPELLVVGIAFGGYANYGGFGGCIVIPIKKSCDEC